MLLRVISLLSFSQLLSLTEACSSSSSLARDGTIITDPSFLFTVSPPTRWTYPPPVSGTQAATASVNYLLGQSKTSQAAVQAAQNEIMAAFLEALSQSNYPILGSPTATVTYSPDQIAACVMSQQLQAGQLVGFDAGGAVTEVSQITMMVTPTACPLPRTSTIAGIGPLEEYIKPVTFSTRGGISMARYNWERVASDMQSILSFRYNARFRTPITINQN